MAKANPKFGGLTDEQVVVVLEKVASTIGLACDICRSEALRHSDHEAALSFHALDHMLCGAGALADMASRAGVIGDTYDWLCGPVFHGAYGPKNDQGGAS